MLTKYDDIESPVVISMRSGSNTRWDYAKFILHCLQEGHLTVGDVLVVDNASVHNSLDSFEMLIQLLKVAGVKLVFLPAYSPELNPTEHCFGFVKQYLRNHRGIQDKFWVEIVRGFAQISQFHVSSFYKHCLKV